MADSHSNDSKEDQDADTFFDNGIYEKIPSKQQSRKKASVKLTDMVGGVSTEDKEDQDMPISVDNICYDKLTSKLHPKSKVYETMFVNKNVTLTISSMDTHRLPTNHC